MAQKQSGLIEERLRNRHDRPYWLSRQWAYQSLLPRANPIKTVASSPNGHEDACSTELPDPDPAVRALLPSGRIETNQFYYGDARVEVRPMTTKLLTVMWGAGGRAVSIEAVSQKLWRRRMPPSYATLRSTISKANIALRAANCLLKISIRGQDVVLWKDKAPH